jgi:pseudaminic acid synthase
VPYTAYKVKQIIISTGIATIGEIQDVVDICREEGNHEIVLLKCTSAYPAPLEDAHLRMIPNLAETFGVTSGFSDHTLGIVAPVVAATLGAKVIEKHFILDKKLGGPDVDFSLDMQEFASMVDAVRNAEKLWGKVTYTVDEKRSGARAYRRSLYVSEVKQEFL